MNGWRSRVVISAIVIGLVTASTVLSIVVGSAAAPTRTSTATVTARVTTLRYGTLVINALSVFPVEHVEIPLPSFSISGSSGVSVNPEPDSNGIYAIGLAPASYLLTVDDQRFRVSIPFRILAGNITTITLLVVKHAAFPYFTEVPDRESSGWVPKDSSFLSIVYLSSDLMHANDLAFIEVPVNHAYSDIDDNLTGRAIVTDVTSRGEVSFVTLRALERFNAPILAGALLVVYDPYYYVSIVSPKQ